MMGGVFMEENVEMRDKKTESVKKYSKNAVLKSREFSDKKDLLTVLLDDDKLYSKNEIYSIIKNYFKRRGL